MSRSREFMHVVHHLGFDESEIQVLYGGEWREMGIDDALELDEPEGSAVVQLSATLFHKLVMYRATARILASPERLKGARRELISMCDEKISPVLPERRQTNSGY